MLETGPQTYQIQPPGVPSPNPWTGERLSKAHVNAADFEDASKREIGLPALSERKMNENLRRVSEYIGFGDPYKGIWFAGIEESTQWTHESIDSFLPQLTHQHGIAYNRGDIRYEVRNDAQSQRYRSQIGPYEARLAAPFSDSIKNGSIEDALAFLDSRLWQPESATFHCNLFPIGKAALSDRPLCEELFGIPPKGWRAYYATMRRERFDAIRAFWEEHAQSKATICLGKRHWDDFRRLFRIRTETLLYNLRNEVELEVDQSKHILLACHWARNKLTDRATGKILETLVRWKVQIP